MRNDGLSLVAAIGLLQVATGCNQVAGIGRGVPGDICDDASDCAIEKAGCWLATCEDRVCRYQDVSIQSVSGSASQHDCKLVHTGDVIVGDVCPQTCVSEHPQLAAGNRLTCMVFQDGVVKCWGTGVPVAGGFSDFSGQVPWKASDFAPLPLGGGAAATQIATSLQCSWAILEDPGFACLGHSCAVLESGQLKCWGSNFNGESGTGADPMAGAGLGRMGDALDPVNLGTNVKARAVATGADHTCALLDDGSVKCWGLNVYGQLGLGNMGGRGSDPSGMGDNLPAVALGSGRVATAIACGDNHTCALLDDGSIKCWGYNFFGQLGVEDSQNRGDDADEMGDGLPAVKLGTGVKVIAIAAGSNHNCALLEGGKLKCWGSNLGTKIGLSGHPIIGATPGDMGDNLTALDLGDGATAMAVAAGHGHTCALLEGGDLKCWGDNTFGQLGLESTASPQNMGNALGLVNLGQRSAVALALGAHHTCVVLADDEIACWGEDMWDQLGSGSGETIGDDAGEMGKGLNIVAP